RALYARDPLVYRLGRAASPGAVETVDVPDLHAVVKDLGARMVVDVLTEGGPTLARSLLQAGLVDRFVLYLAGRFAGGVGRPMFDGAFGTLGDTVGAQVDEVTTLGDDIRVSGTVS
ncbi:MAG: dihydrofolate reductase family protein, partial [Acidimicrobiia bacterium]